jgi:hypothetical protein
LRFAYLQELARAHKRYGHCHKSKCGQCSRYGQKPRCTQADVEQRKSNAEELFLDKVMRVTRRAA